MLRIGVLPGVKYCSRSDSYLIAGNDVGAWLFPERCTQWSEGGESVLGGNSDYYYSSKHGRNA